MEAMKAGKNVFVEKPLCMTENELEEIKKQRSFGKSCKNVAKRIILSLT